MAQCMMKVARFSDSPKSMLPKGGRHFRFSLKHLLLLVFLVSLPLAWIAHRRHDATVTRQTINAIRARGGSVQFYGRELPELVDVMLGAEPRVAFIYFERPCQFSDDDFQLLRSLRSVPGLSLMNTDVTEQGIAQLKDLPGLKYLDLRQTALGDDVVEQLLNIDELEALDVRNTSITNRGIKVIAGIKSLRALHAGGDRITDEGFLALAGHPRLECLNLSDSSVTDKGIAVATKLPRLQQLFFARTEVTSKGLETIQRAPHLKLIAFNGTSIGDEWTTIVKKGVSVRPYGVNESDPYPEVMIQF